MISKTRLSIILFGVAAVILGVFHGYSEIQQGSITPSSIFINAVGGTDCEPSCFPAITIIPNFFIAGISTVIVGVIMLWWVVMRMNDKKGGIGFLILSLVFLLTGGGFLAPILSSIAGILGIITNKK